MSPQAFLQTISLDFALILTAHLRQINQSFTIKPAALLLIQEYSRPALENQEPDPILP